MRSLRAGEPLFGLGATKQEIAGRGEFERNFPGWIGERLQPGPSTGRGRRQSDLGAGHSRPVFILNAHGKTDLRRRFHAQSERRNPNSGSCRYTPFPQHLQ